MRVFRQAGWSKAQFRAALTEHLTVDGRAVLAGDDGIDEGMPLRLADKRLKKFRPGGLLIVHAGGSAGMWSAVISGWAASGPRGSGTCDRRHKILNRPTYEKGEQNAPAT